jgi:hypothetical protein
MSAVCCYLCLGQNHIPDSHYWHVHGLFAVRKKHYFLVFKGFIVPRVGIRTDIL